MVGNIGPDRVEQREGGGSMGLMGWRGRKRRAWKKGGGRDSQDTVWGLDSSSRRSKVKKKKLHLLPPLTG